MTTADHHEHTVEARFAADPNALTRGELVRANAVAAVGKLKHRTAAALIADARTVEAYIREGAA